MTGWPATGSPTQQLKHLLSSFRTRDVNRLPVNYQLTPALTSMIQYIGIRYAEYDMQVY